VGLEDVMRLVLIEWIDSFGCSPSWTNIEDVTEPDPLLCKSVGWLLVDGERIKVVVRLLVEGTEETTQQGRGDMSIPVACIQRIVDLA